MLSAIALIMTCGRCWKGVLRVSQLGKLMWRKVAGGPLHECVAVLGSEMRLRCVILIVSVGVSAEGVVVEKITVFERLEEVIVGGSIMIVSVGLSLQDCIVAAVVVTVFGWRNLE